MLATYEGANVDLRVPYVGYSSEAESYTAQASPHITPCKLVEKRLSHGFQWSFSITYSHALDEQTLRPLLQRQQTRSTFARLAFPTSIAPTSSHFTSCTIPEFCETPRSRKNRQRLDDRGSRCYPGGQTVLGNDFSGAEAASTTASLTASPHPIVP